MDKVVSRQTHFKRVLEKQLDEIEVRQRQTETRRLKQIRDLGVDLSRIQKTTRDLEIIDDLTPRRYDQRRGSLPVLDSGQGVSLYFESSGAPRSRRRLSCIATIPLAAPDGDEYPDTAYSNFGLSAREHKHLQSRKEGTDMDNAAPRLRREKTVEDLAHNLTTKSASGQSDTIISLSSLEGDEAQSTLRRGSTDINDNCAKDSNHAGHNVTTVFVYDESAPRPQDKAASDMDPSVAETQSMFEFVNKRGRRASEPAVDGFVLRRLQAVNETLTFQQRSNLEAQELRKSIQKNLPSNIVAEEDEERHIEDIKKATELESETSSGLLQRVKLSSISEKYQAGGHAVSKHKRSDLTTDDKNSKKNQNATKSGNLTPFRQRRKSDGDVLVYSNARKLRQDDTRQPSALTRNKYSFDDRDNDKTSSWQSVRKCRYLRGYDPPEMKQPADVAKFVFGPGRSDTLPPKSK